MHRHMIQDTCIQHTQNTNTDTCDCDTVMMTVIVKLEKDTTIDLDHHH